MKPMIVCFSGRIGSGKTTVSIEVAKRLGLPRASFGDYVRSAATSKGLDSTAREILAPLGEQIIEELGWDEFCRRVLQASGWDGSSGLIVDGIRHLQALQQIQAITSPLPVLLVHLQLSRDALVNSRQKGKGVEQLAGAEKHSTEIQVTEQLPNAADLLLDAGLPLDAIVNAINEFIEK
jgi:cytidylate kinase